MKLLWSNTKGAWEWKATKTLKKFKDYFSHWRSFQTFPWASDKGEDL